MVRAVDHCHSKNIVHCDVKMENFLVEQQSPNNENKMVVKLADFGLAQPYHRDAPLTEKMGSLLSIAPELLSKDSFGPKIDCWALGIILYELLGRKLPFYNYSKTKHMKNIVL